MQISHLHKGPFDAVSNGQKTIEARLYDEKRQLLKLGDLITYINRDNLEQTITVRITGLLRYPTFHDLYSNNDIEKFGGSSIEMLESQAEQFYSKEEQLKNGVVGIEFFIVD